MNKQIKVRLTKPAQTTDSKIVLPACLEGRVVRQENGRISIAFQGLQSAITLPVDSPFIEVGKMNQKTITLVSVFNSTCFGCDGRTTWMNADFAPAGQFIRLYCGSCGADVHPEPGGWTLGKLRQQFEAWKRKKEAEEAK